VGYNVNIGLIDLWCTFCRM